MTKSVSSPAASKRSKVKSFTVAPRDVRAAFHNGDLTVPDAALPSMTGGPQGRGRGRVHKDAIEAFIALNPGAVYAEKTVPAKSVTLPVTKTSKTGATLKRPVDVSLAEARRLSGTVGQKGRLSGAAIEAAARAYEAEQA
jgi:hypothetical protein